MPGMPNNPRASGTLLTSQVNVTVTVRTAQGDTFTWTHQYGQGRVFFTTLGHGPGTFENASVQRMLGNAVRWTAARG